MFLQAFVIILASGFPEFFYLKGTTFLSGYYAWFASFVFIASGMSPEGQEVGDQKVIKEADERALPI